MQETITAAEFLRQGRERRRGKWTEARKKMNRLIAEKRQEDFFKAMEAVHLPWPEAEYKFAPDRKWRADYAWPVDGVILEVEGAVGYGRHTRARGFRGDMEKYNAAAVLGFRLIRVEPLDLCSKKTMDLIHNALFGLQLRCA